MRQVWEYLTTKKQWEDYMKDLLQESDNAVKTAVLSIYARQTELERQDRVASEDNNVGFTKHDAREMSEIAEKLNRGEELTAGELAKSRNKMKKYWRQLMEISIERMERKRNLAEEQKAEEELRKQEAKKAASKKQFEESIRVMRRCADKGISCDYGICDECPVTQGLQMRLNLKEADE